jgi:hypothetical protein
MIKIIVSNKIKLFFNISFKNYCLFSLCFFISINHAAESQKKLTLLARLEDIPEYNKFQCINYWAAKKEGFSQEIIIMFPIKNNKQGYVKFETAYIKVETAKEFEELGKAINKILGPPKDKIENVQENDKIKFPQDQNQQQQYQSYQNQQYQNQQLQQNNEEEIQPLNKYVWEESMESSFIQDNKKDQTKQLQQNEEKEYFKRWKLFLGEEINKNEEMLVNLKNMQEKFEEDSDDRLLKYIKKVKESITRAYEETKKLTIAFWEEQ